MASPVDNKPVVWPISAFIYQSMMLFSLLQEPAHFGGPHGPRMPLRVKRVKRLRETNHNSLVRSCFGLAPDRRVDS
jgi:hypothetical protein